MVSTPTKTRVTSPLTSKPRYRSSAHAGAVLGFRSGLEEAFAKALTAQGVPFDFEQHKVKYVVPSRVATYTPDFLLRHNGIIVETKGRFEAADREKHLLVRAQHPDLDIRFVFSRSKSPIRTGSPTTYADWCNTHGFLFADKTIPQAWLTEPADPTRMAALERASAAPNQENWACFKLAKRRT